MKEKKKGKRTCTAKGCKVKFEPRGDNQVVCSPNCGYAKTLQINEKKITDKVKQMKKDIKTYSEWLKELQVLVNKYIRTRDKGKNCVSCNKPLQGKFDAGHFLSVGNYPNLRFNEDNIHGQCVHCNRDLHGNQTEYGENLIERIGSKRYEALMDNRKEPLKLSIPEIQELKKHYKSKIKSL